MATVGGIERASEKRNSFTPGLKSPPHPDTKLQKVTKTHTREIRISDHFLFLQHFYQIWYNGMDLDRFCAPDRITEKSIITSSCFYFSAKTCLEYYSSGRK